MSNYKNGKIYKLTSPNTHMIYIGSTIQPLETRFIIHRHETKHNKGNSSANMFIWGDPQIELIENYPCNSKKELLLREQYYMDLHSDYCVNARTAYTDKKEYGKKYRESERGRHQLNKWKEDNKEHMKEYYRRHDKTPKRQQQRQNYRDTHKRQKSISDKSYRENNREKVLASKKRYYDYLNNMGGDYRYNNNITRIDPNIFS